MAFDIAAAASAAGGVAQGIGSILTIGAQKRAATKQFERQKELQEHAGEKQMDIWNRTNYGAQVDHMKRAGLNPALMYGMGGGAGGTTGSVGTGQASQQEVMDIGGAVAQNRLVQAQVENLEADAKKKEAEADNIEGVDRTGKDQANRSAAIDLQVKEALGIESLERQARIEQQSQNTENTRKIREFDAWMDEAFDQSLGEIKTDAAGSYSSTENDLIRKVQRAGLQYVVKDLERLKKDLILKDDEHTLNEIEKEIRNFKEDLTKYGLNEATSSILTKVLQLIFGGKRR